MTRCLAFLEVEVTRGHLIFSKSGFLEVTRGHQIFCVFEGVRSVVRSPEKKKKKKPKAGITELELQNGLQL